MGLENSFVTSSVGYVQATAEKKVDKNNIKKKNKTKQLSMTISHPISF